MVFNGVIFCVLALTTYGAFDKMGTRGGLLIAVICLLLFVCILAVNGLKQATDTDSRLDAG
jgi:Tfp pilus assembly protein PilX